MEVLTQSAANQKDAGIASRMNLWRDRIDAQRGSGQSVRAWCKANDAREHSFYWWRVRLGLSPAKPRFRRSSKPISFARVVVAPRVAAGPALVAESKSAGIENIRLRLAGKTQGVACVRELIFPASMPLEQVARLVHAIEDLPSIIEGLPSSMEGGGEACRICLG